MGRTIGEVREKEGRVKGNQRKVTQVVGREGMGRSLREGM